MVMAMGSFMPWALVALCSVLAVASRSISDSFVVFVPALESAFGGSRGSITAVYGFALLVGGVGAPVTGWIADRFGLRVLTLVGLSASVLATSSASLASEVWHLYLGLGIVMGFAGAALSGVLTASLLGRWFPSRRLGTGLAVAWSASGFGGILVLPVAQHLIAVEGWRGTYLTFALASAALLPVLLVMPWRRIEAGALGIVQGRGVAGGGPTVGQAMRDWPFWALALTFFMTSLGVFSVAPQAMVYLLERGLDGAYAARALAIAAFLTPLGMVGFSWLADRGGRKLAAILAYGSTIAGIGALYLVRGPGDEAWLWLFVLLFGGSVGSRGPMISTLATMRYRGAHFGKIYGLITVAMGVGGSLGAYVGGLLHDLTGGYDAIMLFAAGCLVVATLALGGEAGAREKLSRPHL